MCVSVSKAESHVQSRHDQLECLRCGYTRRAHALQPQLVQQRVRRRLLYSSFSSRQSAQGSYPSVMSERGILHTPAAAVHAAGRACRRLACSTPPSASCTWRTAGTLSSSSVLAPACAQALRERSLFSRRALRTRGRMQPNALPCRTRGPVRGIAVEAASAVSASRLLAQL